MYVTPYLGHDLQNLIESSTVKPNFTATRLKHLTTFDTLLWSTNQLFLLGTNLTNETSVLSVMKVYERTQSN